MYFFKPWMMYWFEISVNLKENEFSKDFKTGTLKKCICKISSKSYFVLMQICLEITHTNSFTTSYIFWLKKKS